MTDKKKADKPGAAEREFSCQAEAEGKGLSTESTRELPPDQILGAEDFLHAPPLCQIHHLST